MQALGTLVIPAGRVLRGVFGGFVIKALPAFLVDDSTLPALLRQSHRIQCAFIAHGVATIAPHFQIRLEMR
ncbi:hypothetical protein GQ56_0108940 [Burkholderia paludis]|nr:hypothetical protein GQ56_0108940 [Burkholderia paludis]